MYDVVIIGAGVIGCAIARELSRFQLHIVVVEKNSDICEGTSKANSGIVHAGFDAKAGSLKAKFNTEGNLLMGELASDLDIPFRRNGTLVLCFSEMEKNKLEELYQKGIRNHVPNLEILNVEELRKLEPNISEEARYALYAPTGGIICPFTLTIALAENAFMNGVEFRLEHKVLSIERINDSQEDSNNSSFYKIYTNKGIIESKLIINAAGVYADDFHNMVSSNKITITARRGEYSLIDKSVSGIVDKTVFQLPGTLGKGVLVTPTIHGNILIGPSAMDTEDKERNTTTAPCLEEVMKKARRSIPNLPYHQIITAFSGLRAHEQGGDFILGEVEDASGFIDAAGMESPGLTCAPAIGIYIRDIVTRLLPIKKKENFIATRKGIHSIIELPEEERDKLIAENPAYGQVICRCEKITEGEIMEAIHRPLGATTLDGIKRRTRAGMGRCQAGFCTPKIMDIVARERERDQKEITKFGGESKLLIGRNKNIETTNVKIL